MSAADTNRLPATFNRLAWSNLAAQSAEQIALAAAPIVAVLLLGVGEGQTGLLQTALTLPFILFAIPAGMMADRISRRRLMAGAEALRAAALLAILALIGLDLLTLPLLALLGFVAVCGTVVYSVAAPSLVPSLVPPSSLPAANARIELARTVAFAGGPALGGALVGWLGAAPAFGVAAVLSIGAAVVMALTSVMPTPLLAGLSFFLLGAGPILWVISTTTLRQSVTPPSLLGRVSAINIMSYGARPLGAGLGALIGGLYSAEACLYLAVAIFAAQALVILMSPAVRLARQPDMVGEPAKG